MIVIKECYYVDLDSMSDLLGAMGIDVLNIICIDTLDKYVICTEKSNNIGLESTINTTKKQCIFKPIIQVFDKSNTHYFPSYFLPSNLKIEEDNNKFNLLEYIIYNQYEILANYKELTEEFMVVVNNVLDDRSTEV